MVPLSFSAGPNIRFRAHEQFLDRREKVVSARTFFYEDEAHCDENMENFLKGIDAVSGQYHNLNQEKGGPLYLPWPTKLELFLSN